MAAWLEMLLSEVLLSVTVVTSSTWCLEIEADPSAAVQAGTATGACRPTVSPRVARLSRFSTIRNCLILLTSKSSSQSDFTTFSPPSHPARHLDFVRTNACTPTSRLLRCSNQFLSTPSLYKSHNWSVRFFLFIPYLSIR